MVDSQYPKEIEAVVDRVMALVDDVLGPLAREQPDAEELARRLLVRRLTRKQRTSAKARRALNARKFVAQQGRCAKCAAVLSTTVFRRPHALRPEEPIVCSNCYGTVEA